jgi:hypothetical protein
MVARSQGFESESALISGPKRARMTHKNGEKLRNFGCCSALKSGLNKFGSVALQEVLKALNLV